MTINPRLTCSARSSLRSDSNVATYILIHGSWHGGWCYDRLVPLLEAAGHTVDAPDLPGMGASDQELAAVTLSGWAEFAIARCRAATSKPVILAGHSRGGIVISQAAEYAPEVMDALVYIAALMLPSGTTRNDWKANQTPNPAFDGLILPHRSRHATVVDTTRAASVFAQLSPPEWTSFAAERLVAEPNAPRMTPLSLTPDRYGRVPRHYIACAHDNAISLEDQEEMQALQPCETSIVLDTDHSPFFSAPEDLARALISIAERTQV